MRLPGSSSYLVAFLTERILAFLLMKFLIQDVSPEIFGLWTQVITTSSLISVVLIWRLDNGLITTLADEPEHARKTFFALGAIILLPLSLFMWLIVTQYEEQLSTLIFGESSYKHLLIPLIFISISEAVLYLVYGYLRSLQKSFWMSSLYFIRFGFRSILLILFLVKFHFTLSQALISLGAFNLILAILFFLPGKFQKLNLPDLLSKSKLIFRESSGQLLVVFFYWVVSSLDRYVLLYFFDISILATHAFLLGIAAPIALFPSIMQQTLLPALSTLFEKDESIFQTLSSDFFRINIFIGIGAGLGFIAASDYLVRFLGTKDFQIELEQIILVAALMFSSIIDQILGGILTAQKRAIEHSRLCFIMTVSLFFWLFALVPLFGISGALAGRLCANLIQIFLLAKMLSYSPIKSLSLLDVIKWGTSGCLMVFLLELGKQIGLFSVSFFGFCCFVTFGMLVYLALNFNFFSKKVIPSFLKEHTS